MLINKQKQEEIINRLHKQKRIENFVDICMGIYCVLLLFCVIATVLIYGLRFML